MIRFRHRAIRRLIPIGCRGRFISIVVERRRLEAFDRAARRQRRLQSRKAVVWYGDQAIDLNEVFA